MNGVDIVLAALILFGALRGFSRGFVSMALGIAAFVAAVLVAHATSPGIAAWLNQEFHLGYHIRSALDSGLPAGAGALGAVASRIGAASAGIVAAIAFLGVLLGVEMVLGGLLMWIGRIPNRIPLIGPLNRAAGGLLGLAESAAMAAFAMLLIVPMARAGALGAADPLILHSRLALLLAHAAQGAAPALRRVP